MEKELIKEIPCLPLDKLMSIFKPDKDDVYRHGLLIGRRSAVGGEHADIYFVHPFSVNAFILICCDRGEVSISTNSEEFDLKPGTLYINFPGQIMRASRVDNCAVQVAVIDLNLIRDMSLDVKPMAQKLLALKYAQRGEQVTLVDLDIVNPYFRSSERTQLLEAHGIRVYAPSFAMSTVDVPSLPADIQAVFADKSRRVIFDVGGDDTGAAALGQYKPNFDRDDVQMLFVVNAFRPLSGDADSVCDLMHRVAARARLTPSAMVNNANVAWETGKEELERGETLLSEVSARMNLPVGYLCAKADVMAQLTDTLSGERITIDILMRPEWL